MSDTLILAMGEKLLTAQARLDVLEVAFLNLLSLQDNTTLRAFETVFREVGEEQVMASDEEGQQRRQNLAAVRLGKKIEAIAAKRGSAGS